MTIARVRIRPGPYALRGPAVLVDEDGHELTILEGASVVLCRCGQSKTKPFCDSSHKVVGFAGGCCLLETEEGKSAVLPSTGG